MSDIDIKEEWDLPDRVEAVKNIEVLKYFCFCGQQFSNSDDLKSHGLRVHKFKTLLPTVQTFICSRCRKCFDSKQGHDEHICDVHEGKNKPFECRKCDESFKKLDNLNVHIASVHERKKSGTFHTEKQFYAYLCLSLIHI